MIGGGCPIIWKSKLISEICLSTMESGEYISLSKSCRDLLPLQCLVQELGEALNLDSSGKIPPSLLSNRFGLMKLVMVSQLLLAMTTNKDISFPIK